jgi:glucose/arabinose dehydrogenase
MASNIANAARLALIVVLGVVVLGAPIRAAAKPAVGDGQGRVSAKELGTFDRPMYVEDAPGYSQLLFVVEQRGTIAILRGSHELDRTFLDIRGLVRGPSDYFFDENGLLSVAFPPDYRKSRRFYVAYIDLDGDIEIDEFKHAAETASRADVASRRKLIEIPTPGGDGHYGGQLQFGPDGYLYLATGDGGPQADLDDDARDPSSLLGKLLRIDPRPSGDLPYTIPPDNPYVGADGRGEIYSYGFRNPWHFSFDRRTGDIAIADVGHQRAEEVNLGPLSYAGGANFGWPQYEADLLFDPDRPGADPPTFPLHTYSHDDGCAITGGYVVRDRRLRSLYGRYLYADFCVGELRSFVPNVATQKAKDDKTLGIGAGFVSTFGEGLQGRIYFASLASGEVFKLVPR